MYIHSPLDFLRNKLVICSLNKRQLRHSTHSLRIIRICKLSHSFLFKLGFRAPLLRALCPTIPTHNKPQNLFNPCQQARTTPSLKYPPPPLNNPVPPSPPRYPLSRNNNNSPSIQALLPHKTHSLNPLHPSQPLKNNNLLIKTNSTSSSHKETQWVKI